MPYSRIRRWVRNHPTEVALLRAVDLVSLALRKKEYVQLRHHLLPRKQLLAKRKKVLRLVHALLLANQLRPVKVFGRIKSLSSIIRKLKTTGAAEAERDLFGITILMKTKVDCERVLQLLSRQFIPMQLPFKNPRNFYNAEDKPLRSSHLPTETEYITLYVFVPEISFPVHFNIMRPQDWRLTRSTRGIYLRNQRAKSKK